MWDRRFLSTVGSESAVNALAECYRKASPFPHIVLQHVVDYDTLKRMETSFPRPTPDWWRYENPLERKFALDNLHGVNPTIQATIAQFNSNVFVRFLEKITGIENLIVDHTLRGGGLHQSARGGMLGMHIDHNVHAKTGLDRRLNVILYLNEDWKPEWRGSLELWSSTRENKLSECKASVLPSLGHMVIFSTTEKSWHGFPDPIECPEGVTRKSIALYYWSNGRPEHEKVPPHSTMFAARPTDPIDPELEKLRNMRVKGRLQ